MKIVGAIGLFAIGVAPCGVALLLDPDLSSKAHVPVLGTAAAAVALCDALFGQIVALTGEIPFLVGGPKFQTKQNVARFESYHAKVFWAWAVTKVASALSVMLSATTLVAQQGDIVWRNKTWLLGIGYALLGVSFASVMFFLASYLAARRAVSSFRLDVISRENKRINFDLKMPVHSSKNETEEEARQYADMEKYNAPASDVV